jgi:hypothetical protein
VTLIREDMWLVTVRVEGLGDLGVFDKFTGGEVDSDEQKYRPGGMAPPVSLGGAVTMGNVVLERAYDLDRDHALIHQLSALAGVAGITASKQPLDLNKVPYGRPIVQAGKLKQVASPDHDSTSSDPAILHLEFVPSGTIG